jgi:hypothetical protein
MKARLLIVAATLALGACMHVPPQSREEFRATVLRGEGPWRVESFVVDRSFEQVVDHLSRKTDKCFNVVVTKTVMTGMSMSSGYTKYNSSIRVVRNDQAELTVQKIDAPRTIGPTMPEGGFYLMGADISAVSPSKTRIELYRPTLHMPLVGGFGGMGDAVHDWSRGKDTACPKLP